MLIPFRYNSRRFKLIVKLPIFSCMNAAINKTATASSKASNNRFSLSIRSNAAPISIDTRTEIKIQEAFAKMMKGRTSFIVAHRLSTIQEADIILVMKDGHIIEQGRHEELLAKKGFYANLYESQFVNTSSQA